MIKKQDNKKYLLVISSLLTTLLYPILFLYLTNVGEANLAQMLKPFIISLIVQALLFGITFLITKCIYKSAIIAILFFFLIFNYKIIEAGIQNFLPQLKYWHITVILIVTLLHIAYFLYKKMSSPVAFEINKLVTILFTVLIVFNFVTNFGAISNKISVMMAKTDDEIIIGSNENKNMPNVYYIIMDEYSNFDVMEKHYGYDNKVFFDFLTDKGFAVSPNSSNDPGNITTLHVTTNYLNLDYVAKYPVDSVPDVQLKRKNPPMFKLLNDEGYSISYSSNEIPIEWDGPTFLTQNTKINNDEFYKFFMEKNIVYPFMFNDEDIKYRKMFFDSMEFLDSAFQRQNNSQFTYMHSFVPHGPFVFGENGEKTPVFEQENYSDKKYYINQYKYVTSVLMDSIDEIIKNDPSSVIILQSDHSMRNQLAKSFVIPDEDKVRVLNAVYYKGENIDEIKGQSPVNTLRLTFNRLLDMNMEIVEAPIDEV